MEKDRIERRWDVYHELYIDIFFLVNFMMDYLLLLIVRRMLKCSATHGNICIGSILGSLLTCAVIMLQIRYAMVRIFLFHIVINTLMLRVGLRIKEKREFFRGLVGLYTAGFLLGGVFQFFQQYVRVGSLFFGIAVLSYYVVQGIWSFITCLQRFTSYRCKVTLFFEEGECTVEALIDTGNSLTDPITGNPVCILESEKVKDYISCEKVSKLRKIPFCSLGEREGMLPVMEIEKMCVQKEKEYRILHPVIGICGERISGHGTYGMILNPDIF